jgi:hypothetical protein
MLVRKRKSEVRCGWPIEHIDSSLILLSELVMRVGQLESQLTKADKKISDMSRSVSKLHHFKQSVMDSFGAEDIGEIKQKVDQVPFFM